MKRDPATDEATVWVFARDFLYAYMPKTRGLSPATIQAYRLSLECFLTFLEDHKHLHRSQVTFDHFDREHLKGWLTWMNTERGYTARTITLRLAAVKAFLSYAAAEDLTLIALDQAAKTLTAPVPPRAPIEYLTQEATRAVLAAHTGATAKSRRNRMLLILLYETAARVGEITALTLQDLTLTDPGHVTLTGKRNKTRVVPLSAKTLEHLQVYLQEFHPNRARLPGNRPVFYSFHRGQPTGLSTDTVAAALKAAAETARSLCPSVPARVHCHMLRKTKAMNLHQSGIPLPIIMRLLGHENVSTTQAFYAFATLDMMREAINAATPATGPAAAEKLPDDMLQALYSLR